MSRTPCISRDSPDDTKRHEVDLCSGSLRLVGLFISRPKNEGANFQSLVQQFPDDSATLSWKESPLHDTALNWSTTVEREWLLPEKPSAMPLLANFGWNQLNVTTAGLEVYRGPRMHNLIHSIINHPWFHPTAWEDINSGRLQVSQSTRYYVFLDRDTCL